MNEHATDCAPAGSDSEFLIARTVSTRWADIDVYGHVNNAVYSQLFDTAINGWIMEATGFDPVSASVIGVVVRFACTYRCEIRFPQTLSVGLRVRSVGTSSVTYDLQLLIDAQPGHAPQVAAQAEWVHVYIDRHTRRPVSIPASIRALLRDRQALAYPSTAGEQ